MMIQVWLIGVTGRQTVRCVLSTKSCAVTCFCFLAQDTKQKQFLGQKYPVEHNGFIKEPETTMNLIENPEPVVWNQKEKKLNVSKWWF